MSKEGIVYVLMILNVNTCTNVILQCSLCANEGHFGVDESISTIVKQIWTQMIGYFLLIDSKRCFVLRLVGMDQIFLPCKPSVPCLHEMDPDSLFSGFGAIEPGVLFNRKSNVIAYRVNG